MASWSPGAPARNGAHIARPGALSSRREGRGPGGGSGRQQTKYELETPAEGLRFANKASPIFVRRRPHGPSGSPLRRRPFLSRHGWKRTRVRRGRKAPPNQLLAESPTAAELCRGPRRCQVWLPNCCLPMSVRAPIRDRGEGTGDKQGQNQRRIVSLDSAREKQRQSERRLEPDQVMVANALNSTMAAGVNPSSPP